MTEVLKAGLQSQNAVTAYLILSILSNSALSVEIQISTHFKGLYNMLSKSAAAIWRGETPPPTPYFRQILPKNNKYNPKLS